MTPALGLAHEMGRIVLPLEVAKIYRELGVTKLRYMVQRRDLETERGKFDWAFVDETIGNAQKAGLRVMFNLYFLNEWMIGDRKRKLVTSYDCECTKTSNPLPIEEAPQCYDPAIVNVIDSDAIEEQAATIAKHLAGRIDFFGVENEPGVRDYFLTSRDDTPQSAIERWYHKIAKPFVRGIRAWIEDAQFSTQFDLFCDYARCLELDRDFGDNLGVRCFNQIGIHPYADTTELVEAKVRDEFQQRMSPWLDGRPLAIAEIQQVDNVRLMRELQMDVTEHNPARYVTMHQEWSPNGPVLVPGVKGGPRTFALTDEGRQLQKDMARFRSPSRRHSAKTN